MLRQRQDGVAVVAETQPVDGGRFYETARRKLIAIAGNLGLTLRHTDACKAPRLAYQGGSYAHVWQIMRIRSNVPAGAV